MTSTTLGPWQVGPFHNKPAVFAYGFKQVVATMGACPDADAKIEVQANAEFIVAAFNACDRINSDNPLAVVEALPELVAACRRIVTGEREQAEGIISQAAALARAALAQLEGQVQS